MEMGLLRSLRLTTLNHYPLTGFRTPQLLGGQDLGTSFVSHLALDAAKRCLNGRNQHTLMQGISASLCRVYGGGISIRCKPDLGDSGNIGFPHINHLLPFPSQPLRLFDMLSKVFFIAALITSSFALGNRASAIKPKVARKTLTPYVAQLAEYTTPLPYATVIARLDAEVNKTGSLTFANQWHAAKTKEEQVALIADVTQGRNFLYFYENNHRAWMDIYDPSTPHLSATTYTIGNPNFAFGIVPLDYDTGLHIPLKFLIVEEEDHSGTRVIFQQQSSVLAPFNKKNTELQKHIKDLENAAFALFDKVTAP